MTIFKKLGLNSEIIKSLDDLGFEKPSPIQEQSIPFLLDSKKDLIALAQTGTGKTAAYSLPILNQINKNEKDIQAIILCPTRELCIQISQDIKSFAKYSKGISITPVFGGENIIFQIKALKSKTTIVVGTPGRVNDLIRRKVLKLQSIKYLVMDEADEMLDMGFKNDLDAILKQTPAEKQTLLFSATMSKSVSRIAQQYMKDTHEISIGEKNTGADKVTHEYYIVQPKDRLEALRRILDFIPNVYGILFCRTRRETQAVADRLKQINYNAEALHGEIAQTARTKIMDRFKQKKINLLVATDVAARGIDVNNLTHVINYNLPDANEAYTHRSGRTGRAENCGISISILTPRDVRRAKQIETIVGKPFEHKKIPNQEEIFKKQIDNFFNELKNSDIKQDLNKPQFSEFAKKLEKLKKEDLIKHFYNHKFGHLNNVANSTDLNAQAAKTFELRNDYINNTSLKINIGKKHGFDIKALFGLINSNKMLKGLQVGRINLLPEYSIFSVEKTRANETLKNLKGITFRGIKIDIKISDEIIGYQRIRRSRPNPRFNRKRNNFKRKR